MISAIKNIVATIIIAGFSVAAYSAETTFFNSAYEAENFCIEYNCFSIVPVHSEVVKVTYEGRLVAGASEAPNSDIPSRGGAPSTGSGNGLTAGGRTTEFLAGLYFFDNVSDTLAFCRDSGCIQDCSTNLCRDYIAYPNYTPNPPYDKNIITLYVVRTYFSEPVSVFNYKHLDGPKSLREVINACYRNRVSICGYMSELGSSKRFFLNHGSTSLVDPHPMPSPIKPGERPGDDDDGGPREDPKG